MVSMVMVIFKPPLSLYDFGINDIRVRETDTVVHDCCHGILNVDRGLQVPGDFLAGRHSSGAALASPPTNPLIDTSTSRARCSLQNLRKPAQPEPIPDCIFPQRADAQRRPSSRGSAPKLQSKALKISYIGILIAIVSKLAIRT
jgi:hypothetical protein